ncbi:MAG: small multi-drug export protein [Oscillospiraceae bacterium]|nr:small multi-drug export protein [Oscillospiraceae bacterium]
MVETISNFLQDIVGTSPIGYYAIVFIMSLLPAVSGPPIVISLGVALGLPLIPTAITTVIGNIIPVPFIILFIRMIFEWLGKISKTLGAFTEKLEKKAEAKGNSFKYGMFFGLLLFVAIPLPLPGMGAWTGALIAAIFNVRIRIALPAIAIGVVIAGTITTLVWYFLGTWI